ncbi:putative leucine-rich repeat domain superfamily [Helianthus anomalus]
MIELYDCNLPNEVKCIIHSNELLQLQKLEKIEVINGLYVEEVFQVEEMEGANSVVQIPNLTQLEISSISLKYIWKSNHHHVLEFPKLTTLSIRYCSCIKHLFTSSMVSSLPQLQYLHISDCNDLEVIVKEETESETECDSRVKEIVFPCLKSLKLEKLDSLKGFCLTNDNFSCSSLDNLEIMQCRNIMLFTKGHFASPALYIIDTSLGRCYTREDINSIIQTTQLEVTICLFQLL